MKLKTHTHKWAQQPNGEEKKKFNKFEEKTIGMTNYETHRRNWLK